MPSIVQYLTEAVDDQLGRPSYCRQVKNCDEWFVTDPVFSFVQHGMKKGTTGYRVGYHYQNHDESVRFNLVHSPLMAQLFKRNLAFQTMVEVIRRTAKYRDYHWIYWSSGEAVKSGLKGNQLVGGSSSDFIRQLEIFDAQHDFVRDMFPRMPNTGKGDGPARWAGNTFYLNLADRSKRLGTKEEVAKLVSASWPLFLCLYPVKPIERRTASLARSLRAKKILKACEFSNLGLSPAAGIDSLCRGEVQGAHIKPHALGGSDRFENGLWLCEYHHRATEGRLSGSRNEMVLSIKFSRTE